MIQPRPQDLIYQEFDKGLYRITGQEETDAILDMINANPSANNASAVAVSGSDIMSGVSSATMQTATGSLQSGKSTFDNTVPGYILGLDPKDGNAKLYIGNSTSYLNWDGTNVTIAGNLTLGAGFSIKGGQTAYNTGVGFFIGFSGSTPVLSVGDGTTAGSLLFNGTALSVGTPSLTLNLTADEAIAANAAVAVSLLGNQNVNQTTNNAATTVGTTNWVAQTWTTSANTNELVAVTVVISWPNIAVSDTLRCDIYNASGNLPTGASLANQSTTYAGGPGENNITQTFTFNLAVSPSTQYAIVLQLTHADFTTSLQWSTSDVYTGGQVSLSSNSGGSWTASPSNDLVFGTTEVYDAHIVNANSTNSDNRANAFLGFAITSIAQGTMGPVILDGYVTGFSGLTPASTYYLQNVNGTIGTSAGAQSRKVGVAISATKLLIKYDNP